MFRTFCLIVLAVALVAIGATARAQETSVTIFAAASMKNAVDDINAAFTKMSRS